MILPPSQIPQVDPLPEHIPRPFWSVMIPAYNRPRYLIETLRSVLEQDLGQDQMQIEVVDNCSPTDDIRKVVQELGQGRISYFRQATNIGPIANFNTCVQRSRGKWIHLLHDDDYVLPKFYDVYAKLSQAYKNASLILGPAIRIEPNGRAIDISAQHVKETGPIPDFLLKQSLSNALLTPSYIIPRWVYERCGGYDTSLHFCSDWDLICRAIRLGDCVSTVFPYAVYRVHLESVTHSLVKDGIATEEIFSMLKKLQSELPLDVQSRLPRKRFTFAADAASQFARRLGSQEHWSHQLRELSRMVRIEPSPHAMMRLLRALILYPVRQTRKTLRPSVATLGKP